MPEKQQTLTEISNPPQPAPKEYGPEPAQVKDPEVLKPETGLATTAKAKMENVRGLLEKLKPSLLAVAPKHLTPERLVKVALVAAQRTPRLLDCTPQSLMIAMMHAGELGLEPGGALGHGWLVPFKNNKTGKYEATFIPGYRGLVYLAHNSGEVESIEAAVVYEKDEFDFDRGFADDGKGGFLKHKPALENAGKPRLAYALAWIKGMKRPKFEVMTKAQIEHVKTRSKSTGPDSPWTTDPDEMWKKTVVKRLAKMLPLSPEKAERFARAVERDNRVEAGGPLEPIEGLELVDDSSEEAEPGTKTDQLTQKLVAQNA